MTCKCRWDGNLDGKLIRCHEHAREHANERDARKAADKLFAELRAPVIDNYCLSADGTDHELPSLPLPGPESNAQPRT